MYGQYKLVFVLAVTVTIIFFGLSILSDQYYQFVERENYNNFLAGNTTYSPILNGLPNEMNVVYNYVPNLSPENNLILIGASTTREGILPDKLNLPGTWTVHNFGIGADTIFSYQVMVNYINNYSNHRPDKGDVVVVHIFYATFIEQPHSEDYLSQIIEKTGSYTVDDSGTISGKMSYPYKVWALENYKIYSLSNPLWNGEDSLRGRTAAFVQQIVHRNAPVSPAGTDTSSQNTTDYDAKINGYRQFWVAYSQNATYPGNSTAEFRNLLLQLKKQTNVVVVNMYIPSWQHTPKEQEYEQWFKSDLVPFLQENDIPMLDYSSSIPDSDFGDSAHLLLPGRETYTTLFNKDINRILANVSNKADAIGGVV